MRFRTPSGLTIRRTGTVEMNLLFFENNYKYIFRFDRDAFVSVNFAAVDSNMQNNFAKVKTIGYQLLTPGMFHTIVKGSENLQYRLVEELHLKKII